MITLYIGAVILLTFATLAWMKSKSALADALATKNVLDLAEAIVYEHAAELITSRQLLTTIDSDRGVDDSKWLEERDFFIDQIVEPQVGNVTNSLDRLLAVWQMIDDATAELAASRSTGLSAPPAATGDRAGAPLTTTAITRAA